MLKSRITSGPVLLFIISLFIIGFGLRVWDLPSLGLNHYDEGIYAISGRWSLAWPFHIYERQALFSPPLFFVLIGLMNFLLGSSTDTGAILVNILIGSALIILMWQVVRRNYGIEAGLTATILVVFCEYLILYSRMALTDLLFGFCYILALALISYSFEKASYRWSILAGLAIGAAWNTKYHGWFLLVASLTLILAFTILRKLHSDRLWRIIFCWMIMAFVAGVSYLPWLIYTQTSAGGVHEIVQNWSLFINRNWFSNLSTHYNNLVFLDGWLSRLSVGLAFIGVSFFHPKRHQFDWVSVWIIFFGLIGAGIAFGGIILASIISLAAIPWMIKQDDYFTWMMLSSLGLLFISTPFYAPFPRLLIPWVLSIFITTSLVLGRLLPESIISLNQSKEAKRRFRRIALIGALLIVLVYNMVAGFRPAPQTWIPTDGVREAANNLIQHLPKDQPVYILDAPEIAFYLINAGYETEIFRLRDLEKKSDPWLYSDKNIYFIHGIYGGRNPGFNRFLDKFTSRLHLIESISFIPNDERLLNDFVASEALKFRQNPGHQYDINLYAISPNQETVFNFLP